MEMEESEGHISIQIASILSAIHLGWLGWAAADFLALAPHAHFYGFIPCLQNPGCPRHPFPPPATQTHAEHALSISGNKVGACSLTLASAVVDYSCLIREYLVRAGNEVPIV